MTRPTCVVRTLLSVALVASVCASADAQRAFQVKDINPSVFAAAGYPQGFVEVGGGVLFSATDESSDRELWVTDGTPQGTHRLKDLNPGSASSEPSNVVVMNGVGYFSARTAAEGAELWRTDGTPAGTYLLKDIEPGANGSSPLYLTVVGDRLFFSAYLAAAGRELWVSDGTAAGTVMISDIPGTAGLGPTSLRGINGLLYFSGTTAATGEEPWCSDGTASGTSMVQDVYPGTTGSRPTTLGGLGNLAFFAANTPASGIELWATDRTMGGAYQVVDVIPGAGNGLYWTEESETYGDYMYFEVEQVSSSVDGLWRTDGTASGTTRLVAAPHVHDLTLFAGLLYFAADVSSEGQLWRTDGTAGGSFPISYLPYDGSNSGAHQLTVVGNTIFFFGNDQLWASDGTSAFMVKDILSGSSYSNMGLPGTGLGHLFFSATDLVYGQEPWISDGTSAGTYMLKDVRTSPASGSPAKLVELNGSLLFAANDGATGVELWKSDGTEAGTVLVKDLVAGSAGSSPDKLTRSGTLVYFATVNAAGTSSQLWRTNGTAAGTYAIGSFLGTSANGVPDQLTDVDGTLFFVAASSTSSGAELWKSTGTSVTLVKDLRPYYGSNPKFLTAVGTTLYFTATDDAGSRLYRSDGTTEGTVPLPQGTVAFTTPTNLANAGGKLFFSAYNEASGREPWVTDGTSEGTFMVAEINPTASSDPAAFTGLNGLAYFAANDGMGGIELWKSDGTSAGTSRVADLNPGAASSTPSALKAIGDRLFFTATDGSSPVALWSTDGTAAGTLQVTESTSGVAITSPLYMIDANGTAIFQANDGVRGAELWSADGASGSAFCIHDIAPGSASSSPAFLTMASGRVFFAATDGIDGVELWSIANQNPVANAGADTTATEGVAFQLDGSASSDADGDALTFEWRDAGNVVAGVGAQISMVAPPGEHAFTLIVRDGVGGVATDTVSVTVRANIEVTIQVAGLEGGHGRVEADAHEACENTPGGTLSCTYEYPADGVAHLVAVPASDSVFEGWTGACAGSGANAACDLTLTTAVSVGATFRGPRTLEIGFGGDGSGSVALSSGGACTSGPAGCTYPVRVGSTEELTATPAADSRFDSWTGACASQGPVCTLTVVENASTQAVFVLRNHPPIAAAAGPYAGVRNQAIVFNGSGSNDPDGDGLTYAWTFGDGATGTGVAPTHAYAAAGTFAVTLVVNDGTVSSTPATTTVTIANRPPTASAGGPYTGVRNQAISFDGSGSSDPDGDALTYEWNFGDGATGTGVRPSHGYTRLGSFTVTLVVRDGVEASSAATASVQIDNLPPSVALTSPVAGAILTAPAAITLTATASDPDGSLARVEFYAGSTKIGEDAAAPFEFAWLAVPPGLYSFSARAIDDSGASAASGSVLLTVNALPAVELVTPADGDRFAAPASITLAASASDVDGAVVRVEFFQGSASVGVATEPPYQVTWDGVGPGVYVLTARATDNLGGTAASSPITVRVTAMLAPTADAYVRGGSAYDSRNYGSAAALTVQQGNSGSNQRWTYIKVDLTDVPTVTSARLRLFGALSATTGTAVQTAAYASSDTSWTEGGITWDNKPPAGPTPLAVVTLANTTAPRWYEWDVTPYLQQEKAAGRNVVTLVLKNVANSSPYASFRSREAATERPQVLIVP